MDTTPFELTPAQKSLLQSLSQETGKPVPTLIEEAIEGLHERVHPGRVQGETNGSDQQQAASPRKHIWDTANDLFREVPEEELAQLPDDGAAQVDHYIYGWPKRPA